MDHTTVKKINSPAIFTASFSVTAIAGTILSLHWLNTCPPDCLKEWLCLLLPFAGVLLIILEAGLIGLAFFFAWQHYKGMVHSMDMERKHLEYKRKDAEQVKQISEAENRLTYQRQRDIINDKFRLIEIARKKVVTEQKTDTEETPVSNKTKTSEVTKTMISEEIELDKFKTIFPELFENN
jgi:hypothetical protein